MRILALALLLFAQAALAQPPKKAVKTDLPDVKQWTLDNGLKVLFVPDHKAPVVTVQVYYHAGGKDEPADKRGIAHMHHLVGTNIRGERAELAL